MPMNTNVKPSDLVTLIATIDPDNLGTGSHNSDWVNMADFDAIMAVVYAGELGASATLDAKLEQATDGSGTDAKDVSGASISQLTQADTDDSDKQAIINLYASELDVDNDFTHVRLSITVGTAASDAGGAIYGLGARYQPAADLASVAEIVDV